MLEINKKNINEIELSAIRKGIFDSDINQVDILKSIARQCPLAGGMAVIKARAMVFMFDDSTTYNDREICNAVGITLRHGQQAQVENIDARRFMVFPNPANDAINIAYPYSSYCTILFTLYDGYGREIASWVLDNKSGILTVPTKEISSGAYAYKIGCNGIVKTNGKLVIVH